MGLRELEGHTPIISRSPVLRRPQHFRQTKPAYLTRRRIKQEHVGPLLAVLPHFEAILIDMKTGDLRQRHAQRLMPERLLFFEWLRII